MNDQTARQLIEIYENAYANLSNNQLLPAQVIEQLQMLLVQRKYEHFIDFWAQLFTDLKQSNNGNTESETSK